MDLLKSGLAWKVEDGERVTIFEHQWIPHAQNPYVGYWGPDKLAILESISLLWTICEGQVDVLHDSNECRLHQKQEMVEEDASLQQ